MCHLHSVTCEWKFQKCIYLNEPQEWHLYPKPQCTSIWSSGRCNWFWFKLGSVIDVMTGVQKENYVRKVYWECGWMYYRCTEMTKWKYLQQVYWRMNLGAAVWRHWRNFERRSSLILTTQWMPIDPPRKQTKRIDNSIRTKWTNWTPLLIAQP